MLIFFTFTRNTPHLLALFLPFPVPRSPVSLLDLFFQPIFDNCPYLLAPVERGDCPALLWAGTVLSSSPGGNFWMPQRQKGLKLLEKRPKEGHRDSEGSGGEAIQRVAEGIWFSCREEAEVTPHWDLSAPLKGSRGTALISALCDRGQDPREFQELCQRRIRLGIRKDFFSSEGGQAQNRFSRKWAQPQGCQRSGSVWAMLSGMHRVGLLKCLCRTGVGLS